MKNIFNEFANSLDGVCKYGSSDVGTKLISKEEMKEYLLMAKQGDKKAQEFVINYNEGAVRNVVKKYQKVAISTEDLMQEGRFGILKAIEAFDPKYDVTFLTFASYYIENAIKTSLKTMRSNLVSVSHEELRKISKVRAVYTKSQQIYELATENERVQYISDNLDMDNENVKTALLSSECTESYDAPLSSEDSECESKLSKIRETKYMSPEDSYINNDFIQYIHECLEDLPEKEREVLILHLGLDGRRKLNCAEIAKEWKCSRSWVNQIFHKSLKMLRTEHSELREFLCS